MSCTIQVLSREPLTLEHFYISLLHPIINIFAYGRSDFKVWFFLFYTVLILIGIQYFKNTKVSLIKFFIPIFLLFCIGLGLHVFNLNSYNLPIGTYFVSFSDDEITSSELTHIHENKSAFTITRPLIDLLGIPNDEIDYGAGLHDNSLVLNTAIMLLFSGALIMGVWLAAGSTLPLTYGLLTFILLKNSIDGGLFNFETILSLGILVFIDHNRQALWIVKNTKILSFCLMAIVATLPILILLQENTFYRPLLLVSFIGSIMLFEINRRKRFLLGTVAIILLVIGQSFIPTLKNISGVAYVGSTTLQGESIARIGDWHVYKTSLQNESSGSLYKRLGENRNYSPILIHEIQCFDDLDFKISFKFKTKNPVEIGTSLIDNFGRLEISDFQNDYQTTLTTNHCYTGRLYDLVQNVMKQRGVTYFVLYDLRQQIGAFLVKT